MWTFLLRKRAATKEYFRIGERECSKTESDHLLLSITKLLQLIQKICEMITKFKRYFDFATRTDYIDKFNKFKFYTYSLKV